MKRLFVYSLGLLFLGTQAQAQLLETKKPCPEKPANTEIQNQNNSNENSQTMGTTLPTEIKPNTNCLEKPGQTILQTNGDKPQNLNTFNLDLLRSNLTLRSGGAGNGGDAIVCMDREVKVMLLDSYEAGKMRLKLDLTNPNIEVQTWRSMVSVAVSRLEKYDPMTASKLYDYSMEMVNDFEKFQMFPGSRGKHVYLGHDVIAEINDSEHVSTPEGCEEHPIQMVSQRVPKFKNEFRYEFNKTLWDQLTLQDQAMTILHEAWYRIMLENGATNSRATRYMNGLIGSSDFENYTFGEYIQDLKETELRQFTVFNKSQSIKDKEIKINLKSNSLKAYSDSVCVDNIKMNMSIKESFKLFRRRQKYVSNMPIDKLCFTNEGVSEIHLNEKYIKEKYTLRLEFFQLVLGEKTANESVIRYKSGKLHSFEGIKFSKLFQMFYRCNGAESYTQNVGCEEGPFNNRDTIITNPQNVTFDENERVTNYFN